MPGPITTTFTKRPRAKRARMVWSGAQHAFGKPPYSVRMNPGVWHEGNRTTQWTIYKQDQDPNPIIIHAPAKDAYSQLVRMTSA